MTKKIVEMVINLSEIWYTARILKLNKNIVINTLKKKQPCPSKPDNQAPTEDTEIAVFVKNLK
ncbi:MAG: hypothetical protein GQ581_00940 [Methyloprofundus sp.]|nr:hypothetical protein [Methyloprofundus sp.]